MSGKNGDQTRAQVAWETITLPQSKGGLGIIDPIKQSKALLAKLVVQSLLPRDEVWKKLLLNRMAKNSPVIGKPWKEEMRWIFNEELQLKNSNKWEERFINGAWGAWKTIRKGLVRKSLEYKEDLDRQPLTWNSIFRCSNGKMLGERLWLAWGQLADGPAQSYGRSKHFLATLPASQKAILASQHGGKKMASEINRGLTGYKESELPEAVILNQGWFELP